MSFRDLKLSPALCRTVETCGYTTPTPVQAQSIPAVLAGNDLLAAAQTGTGKTAAFALPILQILDERRAGRPLAGSPRVLVLAPTRELAMQVQESFRTYGKGTPIRSLAVFGGAGMVPQTQSLRRGVDIVVATPGRLLDHMGQGNVSLSKVEILVLDEADRMLDMGFMPDLERILSALPEQRQSLLFSATFPKEIRDLATRLLRDPVEVQVAPPNSAAPKVSHAIHMVEREEKKDLLIDLLSSGSDRQALVFCRTRHGSDRLCRQLLRAGFAAAAIHGDKSQAARTRALGEFKSGRTSVLVATDVAARGLDIRQLPLVVNYDLPQVPEDYIHRIGRTGRAGEVGRAISFVSRAERELLREIELLLNRSIEVAARPPRSTVPAPGREATPAMVPVAELATVGAAPTNRNSGRAHRNESSRPSKAPQRARRADGGRSTNVPSQDRRSGRGHQSSRGAHAVHASKSRESRHTSQKTQPHKTQPHKTQPHLRQPRQDRPVGTTNSGPRPTDRHRSAEHRDIAQTVHDRSKRREYPSSDRAVAREVTYRRGERKGASGRRERAPQSQVQPQRNKFAVSFTKPKGKPFWWPFAGKQRSGETISARGGSSRSPRREDWSSSESGESR